MNSVKCHKFQIYPAGSNIPIYLFVDKCSSYYVMDMCEEIKITQFLYLTKSMIQDSLYILFYISESNDVYLSLTINMTNEQFEEIKDKIDEIVEL